MVVSRSSASLAFLEHQSHEDEERNGQQDVVRHHPENAFGHGVEEVPVEDAELDADEGEEEGCAAQRERDRIPAEDDQEDHHEHQWCEDVRFH